MSENKPLSSFYVLSKSNELLKDVRYVLMMHPDLQNSLIFYLVDKFIPELEQCLEVNYRIDEGKTET